ncbi:asparagine synthase-related protein [Pseudoduganella violaceinigra]|uniref:asparagine synthase-related protein n=1 Tax=Pseudoduganella violaceinigra TaxID=246602 RepID=UPI0004259652|nr:asparagine synthase-related protein [Pseudoduganella violaceinigra]
MSIFAGIVARHPAATLPPALIDQLRRNLSRHPGDEARLREIHTSRSFVVSLELGALGGSGAYHGDGLHAFVAGAPLLQPPGAAALGRDASLAQLAHELAAGSQDGLRASRGTYCLVVAHDDGRLHLATDKCGVRPLYCWIQKDFVIFATAQRILEALQGMPRELDLQGVAEAACFGFPLSDRTPYRDIVCLHAGEVLSVDGADLQRRRYWRWDQIAARPAGGEPGPQRLYRIFREAVRARLGGDHAAAAFLSGGLDSRAIVAALRDEEVAVATSNFAPAQSQDQGLGAMAAERLGTTHSRLEMRPFVEGDPYSKASVLEWLGKAQTTAGPLPRPQVIWSGDGGSVCMGAVYLTEAMYAAVRAGRPDQALGIFRDFNHCHLSVRLMKPELGRQLQQQVEQGMRAELDALTPRDPAHKMFLFLVLNDQRRHLFHHFETLDTTRIEFELPFFDGELLEGVLSEPADPFLRHVFYMDWLACFGGGVLEVPWQAYPGHVPCPLPVPTEMSYQWDEFGPEQLRQHARRGADSLRSMLKAPEFAGKYLSRFTTYAFLLAMRLGKGRLSFHLRLPNSLHRYWVRTQ